MQHQLKNSLPYVLTSDLLVLSLGPSEIDLGVAQSAHDDGDL